jgi:hypothetical protein
LKLISALILGTALRAGAEVQLQNSWLWTRARVIAPGQDVISFQTYHQSTDSHFNDQGRAEPLGEPYSRGVSWRQLLNSQSASTRAELANYVREHGIALDSLAASARYRLHREEVGFQFAWARGLTKRWMIGLQVPLSFRRTTVKTDVDVAPDLAQTPRPLRRRALGVNRGDVRAHVKQLAEAQLANSGYNDIPEEQSAWACGDVNLLSQVALYRSYRWAWSLQQLLRFPTARNPDLGDYFRQSNDEGQMDLGLTSLTDYSWKRWIFGMRLGYVAQMPDSVRMRVSTQSDQDHIEPTVSRDLGDLATIGVDAEYRLRSHLSVRVGHTYLSKEADHYKGRALDGTPYAALSVNTAEQIHESHVEAVYRISSSGSRAGVFEQWQTGVGYSHPWAARNSSESDRASVQLISYF